jgi:hypothetical protein
MRLTTATTAHWAAVKPATAATASLNASVDAVAGGARVIGKRTDNFGIALFKLFVVILKRIAAINWASVVNNEEDVDLVLTVAGGANLAIATGDVDKSAEAEFGVNHGVPPLLGALLCLENLILSKPIRDRRAPAMIIRLVVFVDVAVIVETGMTTEEPVNSLSAIGVLLTAF